MISWLLFYFQYALTTNSNTRENRSEHWLDGAREKFSTGFIEDVKVLLRIIVLISPLPIYWALYEQQVGTWVFDLIFRSDLIL